jgi:hypothetical protein
MTRDNSTQRSRRRSRFRLSPGPAFLLWAIFAVVGWGFILAVLLLVDRIL